MTHSEWTFGYNFTAFRRPVLNFIFGFVFCSDSSLFLANYTFITNGIYFSKFKYLLGQGNSDFIFCFTYLINFMKPCSKPGVGKLSVNDQMTNILSFVIIWSLHNSTTVVQRQP